MDVDNISQNDHISQNVAALMIAASILAMYQNKKLLRKFPQIMHHFKSHGLESKKVLSSTSQFFKSSSHCIEGGDRYDRYIPIPTALSPGFTAYIKLWFSKHAWLKINYSDKQVHMCPQLTWQVWFAMLLAKWYKWKQPTGLSMIDFS